MGATALRHPARLAGASLLRLQTDERLAALAIDGHEPAFAAIVDRYRPALLRYCAGIVGADRAEDAVQQTFIKAHDALTKTTDVQHLRSWIYRIAHNTSLNVLRTVRDDVPLEASHGAAAEGPDAALERAERLRATLHAVSALPERQRAALLLRELEGRSHEEIAEALGVTPGAARQHLMRARAAVRTAVTAVTPYPLIAKLASLTHGVGGWAELGAGTGAVTLAKVTAGVMATGALVGGAVGTQQVIQHRSHEAPAIVRDATGPPAAVVRALGTAATGAQPAAAAAAPALVAPRHAEGSATRERARHRGRHRHHGGGSGSDSGSGSPGGSGSSSGTSDDGGGRGSGNGNGGDRGGSADAPGRGGSSGSTGKRGGSGTSGGSGSGSGGKSNGSDASGRRSGNGNGGSGGGSGSSSGSRSGSAGKGQSGGSASSGGDTVTTTAPTVSSGAAPTVDGAVTTVEQGTTGD